MQARIWLVWGCSSPAQPKPGQRTLLMQDHSLRGHVDDYWFQVDIRQVVGIRHLDCHRHHVADGVARIPK